MKKDCIGNDIRILSHQIHRWIENSPNKKKIDSVTGANAWIIGYISDKTKNNEDVFQKDLEKNFEITRSTASKVVNGGATECTLGCTSEETYSDR